MMQPEDHAARLQIETNLHETMFVDAGAGTGKTTALVGRIFALVTHPDPAVRVPLNRIAAITFSEKAAAELKDRMRARLEAADGDRRTFAQAALAALDEAAIETLHAFALRLLRATPLLADLPPGFSIADDVEAGFELNRRWRRLFARLLGHDHVDVALHLGLNILRLETIHTRLADNWDRFSEPIPVEPMPTAAEVMEDLRAKSEEIDAILRTFRPSPDDKLLPKLQDLRRDVESLDPGNEYRFFPALAAIAARKGFKVGAKGSWPNGGLDEARAAGASVPEAAGNWLNRFKNAAFSGLIETLRQEVVEAVEDRRAAGRLEFLDLLVFARDLLRDSWEAREAARRKFHRIFVDEFQDTDPLQIDLVSLLARLHPEAAETPWRNAPIAPGRAFFVGDPKQSIYRFRRADLEVFNAVRDEVVGQSVQLTTNFRSRPEILGWINGYFGELFSAPGQARFSPLQPGRTVDDTGLDAVRIFGQLHGSAAERRRAEASDVAAEIARLVAGGVSPASITILFPARTSLPFLEVALERQAIPYSVESKTQAFASQIARDLVAILTAISDVTDEVAAVAALRTDALACSDADLFEFVAQGGTWGSVPSAEQGGHVAESLRYLEAIRKNYDGMPVAKVAERVARDGRMFERAAADRHPKEAIRRLRLVLDQAEDFDRTVGGTVPDFVRWIAALRESEAKASVGSVPDRDHRAVRLMTVHAAKGLEFPITFVLGFGVGGRSSTWNVAWSPDGECALKIGSKNAQFAIGDVSAVQEHEKAAAELERDRLFYVAVTRARERLYISAHAKASKQPPRLLEEVNWVSDPILPQIHTALKPTSPPESASEAEWRAAHDQLLRSAQQRFSVTATELARRDVPTDEFDFEREPAALASRSKGADFGRAVHGALQAVNLDSRADVEKVAVRQAALHQVEADRVEAMVRRALGSLPLSYRRGKCHTEVFLSHRFEGVLLEGFLDLLIENGNGEYQVIDYKTDRNVSASEIDRAMETYRLQAACYSLLVREVLSANSVECHFIFLAADPAEVRTVTDLDAAEADVLEKLRSLRTDG